jgi:hypothetical protein
MMPEEYDGDTSFEKTQCSDLHGIYAQLMLIGHSLEGVPGATTVTSCALKVLDIMQAMEQRYHLSTRNIGIIAWTVLALYTCTPETPIQWLTVSSRWPAEDLWEY